MMDEPDRYLRKAAAEAFGKIKSKVAISRLGRSLYDKSSDVRMAAAEALGEIGDRRAANDLIGALKDNDTNVVFYAARALGRLGEKQGLDVLFKSLKDSKPKIRELTLEALANVVDESLIEPVTYVAENDETLELREMAKKILTNLKAKLEEKKLLKEKEKK